MSFIHFFYGKEDPFSQFYKCNFKDSITKQTYNCCEQAMMHKKALLFGDEEIAKKIMLCDKQTSMKAYGRKVKNFDQKIWDENKEKIVFDNNMNKFSQNEDLKKILIDTGDKVLAEAARFDNIWGIGTVKHETDMTKWKGKNLLGKILMRVRNELS